MSNFNRAYEPARIDVQMEMLGKQQTIKSLIIIVSKGWRQLEKEVIIKSFKVYGASRNIGDSLMSHKKV